MTIKRSFRLEGMGVAPPSFAGNLSVAYELACTASALLLRSGVLLEQVMQIAADGAAPTYRIAENIRLLSRQISSRPTIDAVGGNAFEGLDGALIEARRVAREAARATLDIHLLIGDETGMERSHTVRPSRDGVTMFEVQESLSTLVLEASKLSASSDSTTAQIAMIQRSILEMADVGRHNTAMAVKAVSAVEQLQWQATKFVRTAEKSERS